MTSHRSQMSLASSIWPNAGPVFPVGKNSSGSASRQAAWLRQGIALASLHRDLRDQGHGGLRVMWAGSKTQRGGDQPVGVDLRDAGRAASGARGVNLDVGEGSSPRRLVRSLDLATNFIVTKRLQHRHRLSPAWRPGRPRRRAAVAALPRREQPVAPYKVGLVDRGEPAAHPNRRHCGLPVHAAADCLLDAGFGVGVETLTSTRSPPSMTTLPAPGDQETATTVDSQRFSYVPMRPGINRQATISAMKAGSRKQAKRDRPTDLG
jgi:hypothetical protein